MEQMSAPNTWAIRAGSSSRIPVSGLGRTENATSSRTASSLRAFPRAWMVGTRRGMAPTIPARRAQLFGAPWWIHFSTIWKSVGEMTDRPGVLYGIAGAQLDEWLVIT